MKRVPSSRRDITGILFSNILDILRYIFGERKCNGLQYGRRHFWEGRRPSVCSSLQACGGLHVARVPTCVEEGASTVSTEGPKGGEIFKKCQYGEEGTTMRRVAPRHRLKNEPTPLNLLS